MYPQYAVLVLRDELSRRQAKNPRYSANAFAKFLDLDPSLLGKLLTSKRLPTKQVIQHIEKKLGLNLGLYKEYTGKTLSDLSPKNIHVSDEETTKFFHSDWQPYAFLARMNSGTFLGNAEDLAREFGMSENEAKQIFDKIISAELVTKDERGIYRSNKTLTSNKGKFLDMHKLLQTALLNKSIEAINTEKERCHFSSLSFRMSPEHLNLSKDISTLYRRHMTHVLENMAEPDKQSIYSLQISIVPLSKNPK